MEAEAETVVPDREKTPQEKAEILIDGVMDRLKEALKAAPLDILQKRRLIAIAASRVFCVIKPSWFRMERWDKAHVDCTEFGWGIVEIGDCSAVDRARLAAALQKHKENPMALDIQVANLRGYVRQIQIGEPTDPQYQNAKQLPAPGQSDEMYVRWIGLAPSKVLARLETGIGLFCLDEGDAKN